jgi:DMSO/TMAO reductase YedYZ heme-binding membrane subunit
MPLKKAGVLAILGIILLALVITLLFLPHALPEIAEGDIFHVLTRLFGLYGFLFLSIATLTTPFLREIIQAFGKPFLKIHHAIAAFGIAFITLHPIFNAIDRFSLSVFLPSFDSWESFWMLAGRPAFIILYIAVAAALLRRTAPKYWRFFHALTYIALFFGIIHANLIGEDFEIPGIMLIFDALFLSSLASFTYKRYKNYQLKRKQTQTSSSNSTIKPNPSNSTIQKNANPQTIDPLYKGGYSQKSQKYELC